MAQIDSIGRLGFRRGILSFDAVASSNQPPTPAFYVPFSTDLNATIGGGTLTGTGTGSPAIVGGKVDLTGGGSKYVSFAGTNNVNAATQTGCMRVKYTPNASGTPAAANRIALICQANNNNNNIVGFYHDLDGGLKIDILSNVGSTIFSGTQGAWSPTASQEYELELNWDITVGAIRIFIDGTQFGATRTSTGTRGTTVNLCRTGAAFTAAGTSDFLLRDLRVFNSVQHTGNYVPS